MKNIILITAVGLILSLSVFAAAQTSTDGAPVESAVESDGDAALKAWAKVYEVFSHPRCANCHVSDGRPMWSGKHYGETRVHPMFVGGDPDLLFGKPGLMCNTCHSTENSEKIHGPPGSEVWFLAPKEFVWWEKSSSEICEQVKDPARNGGRSLEEIKHHVGHDALVLWGWDPGPGREPAPYSATETAANIGVWAANGAPCPAPSE